MKIIKIMEIADVARERRRDVVDTIAAGHRSIHKEQLATEAEAALELAIHQAFDTYFETKWAWRIRRAITNLRRDVAEMQQQATAGESR